MWTHVEGGKRVRLMWTSKQRIKKFTRFTFIKRLKNGHQKFWQMKYRKFAGQISKIREISEIRGLFSDGMLTRGGGVCRLIIPAHVDACGQGRGQKPDFRVDVINGWHPTWKRDNGDVNFHV